VHDDHPSLETLARWLVGDLDHEEVLKKLAPHFLDRCPTCRKMREEIDRLSKKSGHWSELVAVVETQEAPELLRYLGDGPHEERMRRADEIEELHTWGVCVLLLERSRDEVFSDPARAVETAHLAVRVAGHLGEAYHSGWVLDLQARAFAHLGNARRVLGELKGAGDAFLRAAECLEQSRTGNTHIEAEVLSLKGSLRLDQRRLEEARKLVERSLALYRENEDATGAAKVLLQKVKILRAIGDFDQAIDLLRATAEVLDPEKELRLYAYSRQILASTLNRAGRNEEAERLLPELRNLYGKIAEPLDWLRLQWTEARIAQGLGRLDAAEKAYREVQSQFLERKKSYDAALVSLDLAALLAEQGRTEELKGLAMELMVVFESREVHREAMAALLLFQQACAEERLTVELVRQIAAQLQRERSSDRFAATEEG
jgi:tetratricopeptide (TPR) repeat protein